MNHVHRTVRKQSVNTGRWAGLVALRLFQPLLHGMGHAVHWWFQDLFLLLVPSRRLV